MWFETNINLVVWPVNLSEGYQLLVVTIFGH